MNKRRKKTHSEEKPNELYITSMMGGKIVLSLLKEGKDDTHYVGA